MIDMCELAKIGYFHPKMKGRLSLKYVLPAIWESNEALHLLPEFAKYYRRDDRGQLVNPYDTLAPLPFGNLDEADTDEVVTEGTGAMLWILAGEQSGLRCTSRRRKTFRCLSE
jgi:hypothetical protein